MLHLLPDVSRRGLFAAMAGAGACAVLDGPLLGQVLLPPAAAAGVVGFHADAPYLDPTGTDAPYWPRIATDWTHGMDYETILRLNW